MTLVKTWKVTVGIVLLFALGFVSGATVALFFGSLSRPEPVAGRIPSPGRVPFFLSKRVASELSLNESQQIVFDEAVNEARRELKRVREEVRPRVDAIFKRAMNKIRPSLSEDQKRELEKIVSEFEARHRRRKGRRHK